MKTLRIYERTVTARTQYRQWRYKEEKQIVIKYDGKTYQSNGSVDMDNPKLRIPFDKVLETRKRSDLEKYIKSLGRSDVDKYQKTILMRLIKES